MKRAYLAAVLLAPIALAAGPVHGDALRGFEPAPDAVSPARAATGIFRLGSARFGDQRIELIALLHNGEVLQVQARHATAWLAKRQGSVGGKSLAPSKFDELASIAGGFDTDVRRADTRLREAFARAAGLASVSPLTVTRQATAGRGAALRAPVLLPIADAVAQDCGPIGCEILYAVPPSRGRGYTIRLGADRSVWGFEGYGIVAIWAVPGA